VISAGVYLLRSSLLEAFPAGTPLSFERDVFPDLIRRGVHLQVCSAKVPFIDIGTPESLPQAEAFIRGNLDQFELSGSPGG
jgi:NDP-sugar pyrophosphorylase family protein